MTNDIREVSLPDGSTRKAIEVEFQTIREDWNEYELSDGTRVRAKNVISKILVFVDDEGNKLRDAVGDVEVMVQGSVTLSASSPKQD